MYDVIVIGAGVVGCAVARELSRYRAKVLVVERESDVCCGTSKANSAIVHAGFDAAAGSLMAKLNVEGSRMMEALSRELHFPYRRNGSLVLCMAEEDRDALQALYENGLANGVEGLEILERDALREMEPAVSSEAVAALYAPTGAIVCPFGLTIALAENAAQNGVEFCFDTAVTGVAPVDEGWCVETSGGSWTARAVVNAAGVYADLLHNQVSDALIHITPRRGEYCLLDKTAGATVAHTLFTLPGKKGKGVLVTPTVHGNLLLGPTATDLEDREGTNTSAAGLAEVQDKARRMVPGLPVRQVITSFAGLRAHEDGHEFLIGEVSGAPGFFDCAGIESPGLSAAPAIGRMAVGLVAEKLRLEEKEDFIARREGILDPKQLNRAEYAALIAENPAYGRVVCRCETVTEGEIVDAIRRTPGARDLDGVKRRTRAGMGRCQSGFCGGRVMEILSRELGIPLETVTKSGGASRMIPGRED